MAVGTVLSRVTGVIRTAVIVAALGLAHLLMLTALETRYPTLFTY